MARRPQKKRVAKAKARGPAPKPAAKASPDGVVPIEVEGGTVEDVFKRIRDEVGHWVNKGRYTKVRFKFRGKSILPDIPVAAVAAAEAATFWWAGLLRSLIVNLGARTVLDVEFVSDADGEVARGKELLLGGELDAALGHFEKAVAMDRDCASGHLNIGIAKKLKGDRAGARDAFERARAIDPKGVAGAEAERLLVTLEGSPPPAAPQKTP